MSLVPRPRSGAEVLLLMHLILSWMSLWPADQRGIKFYAMTLNLTLLWLLPSLAEWHGCGLLCCGALCTALSLLKLKSCPATVAKWSKSPHQRMTEKMKLGELLSKLLALLITLALPGSHCDHVNQTFVHLTSSRNFIPTTYTCLKLKTTN